MNFDEMRRAVPLDKSLLELALTVDLKFSTPHFISLFIENDYIEDDGDLAVYIRPVLIEDKAIVMLAGVINGESKYRLPVVFVSKTF